MTGLTRHLDEFLGSGAKQWTVKGAKSPWEVRNLLAVWWRPNFDGFFVGPTQKTWSDCSTRTSLFTSLSPRNAARSTS